MVVSSIGIDLGTTYSLVATSIDGVPTIIACKKGNKLLPSIVEFIPKTRGLRVRRSVPSSDGRSIYIRSIKRLIGKEYSSTACQNSLYSLVEKSGNVEVDLGTVTMSPVALSAEILKSLKVRAELFLGCEVSKAVITVPAYFDEAQRKATLEAGHQAGLDVLRLLSEPIAAALVYGLEKKMQGHYLVYDLGGGTFDVSILKLEDGFFRTVATGGESFLGGDDLDRLIAEEWLKSYDLTLSSLPQKKRRFLVQIARLAKEKLSSSTQWAGTFNLRGNEMVDLSIRLDQFVKVIRPIIDYTVMVAQSVLNAASAQMTTQGLDGIILSGGSTRIPLVQEVIHSVFSCPVYCDVNPEEVVALGAAYQARALTVGSYHLLLDVIPISLGIEVMGGRVEKIIPRNTSLPCSRKQVFTTYQDNQVVTIHVVQGEQEFVSGCRSLARFDLRCVPPLKSGIPRISVTFELDSNCLLTVSAQEELTGCKVDMTVKT